MLPIKRKWFDMILSGEKTEEYREIKPYYTSRFQKCLKDMNVIEAVRDKYTIFKRVKFINGYNIKSPYMIVRVAIKKGYGKEKWGAEPNKLYYVLKIIEILEVGNT